MGNEARVIPYETDQVSTAKATRRANGSSRSAGSGVGAREGAEDPSKCGASILLSDPSEVKMGTNANGKASEGNRRDGSSARHVNQPEDATGVGSVPDERGPRESPGLEDNVSGKVSGTASAAAAAGGGASAETMMGGTVVEGPPAGVPSVPVPIGLSRHSH